MALHLRYIWRRNDGRVAAKMIRVGTFALHEVANGAMEGKKGAREAKKGAYFGCLRMEWLCGCSICCI